MTGMSARHYSAPSLITHIPSNIGTVAVNAITAAKMASRDCGGEGAAGTAVIFDIYSSNLHKNLRWNHPGATFPARIGTKLSLSIQWLVSKLDAALHS